MVPGHYSSKKMLLCHFQNFQAAGASTCRAKALAAAMKEKDCGLVEIGSGIVLYHALSYLVRAWNLWKAGYVSSIHFTNQNGWPFWLKILPFEEKKRLLMLFVFFDLQLWLLPVLLRKLLRAKVTGLFEWDILPADTRAVKFLEVEEQVLEAAASAADALAAAPPTRMATRPDEAHCSTCLRSFCHTITKPCHMTDKSRFTHVDAKRGAVSWSLCMSQVHPLVEGHRLSAYATIAEALAKKYPDGNYDFFTLGSCPLGGAASARLESFLTLRRGRLTVTAGDSNYAFSSYIVKCQDDEIEELMENYAESLAKAAEEDKKVPGRFQEFDAAVTAPLLPAQTPTSICL